MSNKKLEAKKRHHHVWAAYLTRWGGGTNKVFYTTKTGKIANDSVRAIVVEDHFYKITPLTSKHIAVIKGFSQKSDDHLHKQHMAYLESFIEIQRQDDIYNASGAKNLEIELSLHAMKCNALENLHASHEKSAMPVLEALADKQLDILKNQEHMIEFMMFFGHQISRTKSFRDSCLQGLPRRNPLDRDVAESMEHAWWFLSYMFGMSIGLSLFVGRHVARHALLVNDTGVPFITSDQPIVNVHSCVSETELTAPEYADFYYPISPRVAYIICDSERFKTGKNNVDEKTVVELNAKLAARAMVHIIGDSESAISPFQKYIGQSTNKSIVNRE